MFKKLSFIGIMLFGLNAMAQNVPTIVSYDIDTICESDFQELMMTIIIEDLDGDSTFFNAVTNNDSFFGPGFTVIEPATFSGETQRTFQILGDPGSGLVSGINVASVNIEVEGNVTSDGAVLDIDINDAKIFGPVNVTINFGTATFCTSDNVVDLTPYVSPVGGSADHGTNGGYELKNAFSPLDFFNDSGDGLFYTYTDQYGCNAEVMDWPTVFEAPFVSVIPTTSTCGSADGSATATISGQYAPFDVYWTTGFDEQVSAMSTVNLLSSGTYYVNVYDANGCHAQSPAQITDVDLTINEIITDQTCPGDGDGAIDLTISGGTVDNIFWSNGMSTEDITGLPGGQYTVSIHTTGNCQAFKTYTVAAPPNLGISVIAINGEDCSIGQTTSLIDIATWGGSGNYSWDWDSGAWSGEDFTNPGVGVHNCVVMDQTTGCSWSWNTNVPDYGAPYVSFNGVVKPHCNQNDGSIDAYVIVNIDPIASTVWSSGPTTEDLSGIGPGEYTITVTDINGCFTTESIKIEDARPYQPTTCLLTVDTSYVYNQIVWEKDILEQVAGFNVYRETPTLGEFEQVAQRPYALESFFLDNAASPMDKSWRYHLTTYDACGNESYPSFIHKTIHTVAVPVGGTEYEVHWDKYEGLSYTDVDLFRFDNVNGWQNIGTFGVNTLSYLDNPTEIAGLDYMVSFNLTDPCTSTKAQDYNSSRSNKSSGVFDGGGSTTNIVDEEIGKVSIYPNPTNGLVNIYIENPALFESIELRDINGNLITNQIVINTQSSIDMSAFANGIYFVRLISVEKTINHKLIKN